MRESGEPVFYRPQEIGTESTFDPLSISLQYILDSAQVEDFDTDNYWHDVGTVAGHIVDPVDTIDREGGFGHFVQSELFPTDPGNLDESKAILPNVALHTFGGGIVYRKNAEWFEAHGYPSPYLLSGALAMVSEVLAEATEKPVSERTDEIADVYIFRPLGLWLFSDDDRARWIQRTFDPAVWPNLLMWDVEEQDFVNLGLSYSVRPNWFGTKATRPFVYLGITNLLGLSHAVSGEDALSWGFGAATKTIDTTRVRASGGLFYDRDGSLLASVLINGAESYAFRANLHPGVLFGRKSRVGLFLAVKDGGDAIAGVHYRLPIGLAR